MTEYRVIPTAYSVCPSGENPVFANGVTQVSLEDEGTGFFVTLRQCNDRNEAHLRFDVEELEAVLAAAKKLVGEAEK